MVVIPELEKAIKEIERTIDALRLKSSDGWSEKLEGLLAKVRGQDRYTAKEALFEIGELCHPKALGDARAMDHDASWEIQLEALHDSCASAFNKLEAKVA